MPIARLSTRTAPRMVDNQHFRCASCREVRSMRSRNHCYGFYLCNSCMRGAEFACVNCNDIHISTDKIVFLKSGRPICWKCVTKMASNSDLETASFSNEFRNNGLLHCDSCDKVSVVTRTEFIVNRARDASNLSNVALDVWKKFFLYSLVSIIHYRVTSCLHCSDHISITRLDVGIGISDIINDVNHFLEHSRATDERGRVTDDGDMVTNTWATASTPIPTVTPSPESSDSPDTPEPIQYMSPEAINLISIPSSPGAISRDLEAIETSKTKTSEVLECYNCHLPFCKEDLIRDKRTSKEQYLCPSCHQRIFQLMHCYTFKPRPIFHKMENEKDNVAYFGCELETEAKDIHDGDSIGDNKLRNIIKTFSPNQEWFYCKPDATITGVEIVTHPFSLEYWKQRFPLDKIIKYLEEHDLSTCAATCGFHVHMSLTAFKNNTHKVMFSTFLNYQKKRTSIISGRLSNRYAFYENYTIGKNSDCNKFIQTADHHEAINWQNSDTVEVRTFKGIETKNEALAYIEYVDSICKFTEKEKLINIRKRITTWEKYISFIKDRNEYDELNEHLELMRKKFKNINVTI